MNEYLKRQNIYRQNYEGGGSRCKSTKDALLWYYNRPFKLSTHLYFQYAVDIFEVVYFNE